MRGNRTPLRSLAERLAIQMTYVNKNILGYQLDLRRGSIERRADYDDGWNLALIRECRFFVDVGCNQGYFSLVALLDDETRRVIAVDANPIALAIAADNIVRNGFANRIRFFNAFLGEASGEEIDFFSVGAGAASSHYASHARSAVETGLVHKIRSATLDRLMDDVGVLPEFVKIDVEGAEIDVLRGATELARLASTRFLVELHSLPERPMAKTGELVLSWCKEVGHDAFYLKDHVAVTSADAFAHRGRCHLLLQPRHFDYPKILDVIEQSCSIEKCRELIG